MTTVTRYMYDSVTPGDIPGDASLVAVYGTGDYIAKKPDVLKDFPHATLVWIDATGADPKGCTVRDWEPGDEEGSLEEWVGVCKQYHPRPTIYCDRASLPSVRVLTGKYVLGKDYWLWVATLDGTVYQGESVVACQSEGVAQTGGNYDRSVVFDPYWPAAPPVVTAPPEPVAPHVVDVRLVVTYSDGSVLTKYILTV